MTPPAPAPGTVVVVVGFASTGRAVAEVLSARGVRVVAFEDEPSEKSRAEAAALGVSLSSTPRGHALSVALADVELVVVSPGVHPDHDVFSAARPGTLVSEIELAWRMARQPIVAVTGTNGKTSVVEAVTSMLSGSKIRAVAAGNIGLPLIAAVARDDVDLVVAEVSSFQLATTDGFHPRTATFLNFADNHLDWHGSRAAYLEAKGRLFSNLGPDDIAVANADDPVVLATARRSAARLVRFGTGAADYRLEGEVFYGPSGEALATTDDLARSFPHDRRNALAALATALESGADADASRRALRHQTQPPHRLSEVATVNGVAYFDDSKATTPAAVLAALQSLASVVLILGGRNKGLDLGELRVGLGERGTATVRGIVAIGEAAGDVEAAFADVVPVTRATSMAQAVRSATALARRGDAVVLSPGCASFDWYASYAARGDDFCREVAALSSDPDDEAAP